jgi:FkbM family methyltransferase
MKTLIYPNNYPIYITDDTVTCNMFTSDSDNVRVAEFNSIDYVYKKLSEIVIKNGKAKLLDIGSQAGLYSLYSKYFNGVEVDSYEPFPLSYKCLNDNIVLNNTSDRVFSYNIGFSNKKSTNLMNVPVDLNVFENVEITLDTIDSLYENKKVDFLKCDAEGWEYFILQGGISVLKRDKPDLLVQVYNETMNNSGIATIEFFNFLKDLGYIKTDVFDSKNISFSMFPSVQQTIYPIFEQVEQPFIEPIEAFIDPTFINTIEDPTLHKPITEPIVETVNAFIDPTFVSKFEDPTLHKPTIEPTVE